MAHWIIFSLLPLFFLLCSATASDLDNLCSELRGPPTSFTNCHETFKQVPSSSTANYQKLASIIIEIVQIDTAHIYHKLNLLLTNGRVAPPLKDALQSCSNIYSLGQDDLLRAHADAEQKDFSGAAGVLRGFPGTPNGCNDEFKKNFLSNPVAKEAADLIGLAFHAQKVNELVSRK